MKVAFEEILRQKYLLKTDIFNILISYGWRSKVVLICNFYATLFLKSSIPYLCPLTKKMLAMSLITAPEAPSKALAELGIDSTSTINYQLTTKELSDQSVARAEGFLNDTGALVIMTGKFTGRSPKDKFIVKDEITENTVNWNDFNLPIEVKFYDQLKKKML